MKRILAIDQGEHIGGAEMFFSDLLTRVDDDFEIHLITTGNEEYMQRYKNSKVIIHQLEIPKLKPISLKTYGKFRGTQDSLKKLVREIKPELIISNTVRTHLLISSVAENLNIPLIWMAHDKTFHPFLMKWFLKYPEKIISCSKFIQDRYARQDKKLRVDYEVLYPFGIDEATLDQLGESKKEKVIGMVGKFIPWKGQDLFIQMAHETNISHPNYRFEIIGNVYEGNKESEKYFKHCQRLIEDLDLESVFHIKQSSANVLEDIASWEILVHCSKEAEPLGRVVLEGMAAGCAVIASRLGGPKEVLEDPISGLLIHPDERNLSKAVDEYIDHPELGKKFREVSLQKIRDKYLWDKVVSRFKEIIS